MVTREDSENVALSSLRSGNRQLRFVIVSALALAIVVSSAFIVPLMATIDMPPMKTATLFIEVVAAPEIPPVPPKSAALKRAEIQFVAREVFFPPEAHQGFFPEEPEHVIYAIPEANIIGGSDTFSTEAPAPPPEVPEIPVRVGGRVKPPTKTFDVRPIYSAFARDARAQGIVIVEAVIGKDGTVKDAKILRSVHPLLDQSAIEAVKQWRYTPTYLNDVPIEVIVTATVQFTLK